MTIFEDLAIRAARAAAEYRAGVADRPVSATTRERARAAFDGELRDEPTPAAEVIEELIAAAEGNLVGTVGPRFFGFVIGGSGPAATAADMLTAGWDQNAFSAALSPAAQGAELAAGRWLKELLGLPTGASVGFVTGAQGANTVGLAVGRNRVLEDAGWDVAADGLVGAPPIRVVAGEERHATIDRSLRLLGPAGAGRPPRRRRRRGARCRARCRLRADHRLPAGRQREHRRQ